MSRKTPTRQEAFYIASVVALGCIVCRNLGMGPSPAQAHHIRAWVGAGQRAAHTLVIPLCPQHHQHGGHGVAIHAGQETWESIYGSEAELLAQTILEVFVSTALVI